MLTKMRIAAYEAGNCAGAKSILRNRQSRPKCVVEWAEAFQRDQRAEQAARQAEQSGQARLPFRGAEKWQKP